MQVVYIRLKKTGSGLVMQLTEVKNGNQKSNFERRY